MNIDWTKTEKQDPQPMTVGDVPPGHAFRCVSGRDYVWIRTGEVDAKERVLCVASDDGVVMWLYQDRRISHYYPEAVITPGREVKCG